MESTSTSMTTSWKSRPSSLQYTKRSSSLSLSSYSSLSIETLKHQYNQDCKRAISEEDGGCGGVQIHHRPKQSLIRTLQWNIHAFTTANDESSPTITNGFMETIFDANADVIILNEYHWGKTDQRHTEFERLLRQKGYMLFCATTVDCPTAVATRLHVLEMREVPLSVERSAVCLLVATAPDEIMNKVWVIGTHIDHLDGNLRRKEISILLEQDIFNNNNNHHHHHNNSTSSSMTSSMMSSMNDDDDDDDVHDENNNHNNNNEQEEERIIIAGDFNQQRQQDYTPIEWKRISESMKRRNVCEDDGVFNLLSKMDFKCAWSNLKYPNCNWKTSRPPATHWSGTVIDYSYGRNVRSIQASISPAGWSDHRMTVCDWNW